jgi:hypothetical protein
MLAPCHPSLRRLRSALLLTSVLSACAKKGAPVDKHEPETVHIEQLPGPGVKLPNVHYPADLPYSQREEFATRRLLLANGFAETRDEWRRATAYQVVVVRGGAYLLLAQAPEAQDRALFQDGLKDRAQQVQVWAACGLLQLGDGEGARVLERLRREPWEEGQYAALIAARLLGKRGQAEAFETLAKAAAGRDELAVLMNLQPFVALQGRSYGGGQRVDVWPLYRRALASSDERILSVAVAQLVESGGAEAAPLLRTFIARPDAPAALRQQAEQSLLR